MCRKCGVRFEKSEKHPYRFDCPKCEEVLFLYPDEQQPLRALVPKNHGTTFDPRCPTCDGRLMGVPVPDLMLPARYMLTCADCMTFLLLFPAPRPEYSYLHIWLHEVPSGMHATRYAKEQMQIHMAQIDAARSRRH